MNVVEQSERNGHARLIVNFTPEGLVAHLVEQKVYNPLVWILVFINWFCVELICNAGNLLLVSATVRGGGDARDADV